jgi:hypothetical protein
MKNKCLAIFFLLISSFVYSQTYGSILWYFPIRVGNSWTYGNETNNSIETITVQNERTDQRSGLPLYLIANVTAGIGQTSKLYGIENNKLVVLVFRDALGRYQENTRPYPIELAMPGEEWVQYSSGEKYEFRSIKSALSYDNMHFSDCILIEQRIYINNRYYQTKRSYYAKGIGLIYISLEPNGEEERCFIKLNSCNFALLPQGSTDMQNTTEFITVNDEQLGYLAYVITGYTGNASNLIIPDRINNIPVTGIDRAFMERNIQSVIIPHGIMYIEQGSFFNNKLRSIVIPSSVKLINSGAFWENNLTSITIGDNVDIGQNAFDNNFMDYYDQNGRKGGTYNLVNGRWVFRN